MLKVNKKIPEHRQSYLPRIFVVNFEHVSHICSGFSIDDFEKVSKCFLY